jgi:L-asparaginase / beta-aspartyl-peptidase
MPQLVVHGGAGAPAEDEYRERQAAVDRALGAGWDAFGGGALAAAVAAVRWMEDEPWLNAGIGASLTRDGAIELDAALMDGTGLRVGAVAAVSDVRHPVDGARAVMEDGRHVLLVGEGASRLVAELGVERCHPSTFVTERQTQAWRSEVGDTVGAVARDDDGRVAVAVSTGGMPGKLPGRVGDSPLVGCGFYADDALGGACATGLGEAFMRLVLCHRAALAMASAPAADVAREVIEELGRRVGGDGGVILVDARGRIGAAWNTRFMPWAQRGGAA